MRVYDLSEDHFFCMNMVIIVVGLEVGCLLIKHVLRDAVGIIFSSYRTLFLLSAVQVNLKTGFLAARFFGRCSGALLTDHDVLRRYG